MRLKYKLLGLKNMKKAFVISLSLIFFSFSPHAYSDEFNLLVKTCKSCDWIVYPVPFRLKEKCEIARQGIFIKGVTKCERS